MLRGHTIQEVGGKFKVMIGSSIIYGVAVINGLLCSRFYGLSHLHHDCMSITQTSLQRIILQVDK